MSEPNTNVASDDLVRRTLKTVAILVGACVLFVSALSLLAVLATSKAVGGSGAEAAAKSDVSAKKPLSI